MALPPFFGVQVGGLVSLPMAVDPLVARAVTLEPLFEATASASLSVPDAVAWALLPDPRASPVAKESFPFAVALALLPASA